MEEASRRGGAYCSALPTLPALYAAADESVFERFLRDDTVADCLRLEQERIGFGFLEQALASLDAV